MIKTILLLANTYDTLEIICNDEIKALAALFLANTLISLLQIISKI